MNRLLSLAAIALLSVCQAMASDDKPDMKFINEAAKAVWGTPDSNFDPQAQLTDSIFANTSASYIAISDTYNAGHQEITAFGPYRVKDFKHLGETTIDHTHRYMVRLNDSKAVEEFSTRSFLAKTEERLGTAYVFAAAQQAIGVRIYKPDGQVIEVDVSQALPEKEGKKDKTTGFKLAIPGLEPGDVLDCFTFTRFYFMGDQKLATDFNIFRKYPIAHYSFKGRFDNQLTTQINTFNGLEQGSFTGGYGAGADSAAIEFVNLDGLSNQPFCNEARQIPYFRIKVADNMSELLGHKRTSHRPGLYFNLTTPVIMAEVCEHFATRQFTSATSRKSWGLVKNYLKAKPDATWQEQADACWLAALYTALESKEVFDDWEIVSLFRDLLDKTNITEPIFLAVTTPHDDVAIREIQSYDNATPMAIVGDRTYIFDPDLVFRPGEISGSFYGETAFTFEEPREKLFPGKYRFGTYNIPESRPADNTEIIDVTASIDPDNDNNISFAYTSTSTGARKSFGSRLLTVKDVIDLTEEYLAVSDKKRSKRQFDLMAIDDDRRTTLEHMPEIDFGIDKAEVDSVSILSPGFLPDNSTFEYRITGSADGLVTRAGNDLLVNIGNLVGAASYHKTDRDKPRDIHIFTTSPYNLRYRLSFKVPEGYTVDPESLAQLQVNAANICGSYFVQTTYNEADNTVNIDSNFRNNRRIHPMTLWNEFLDLRDAAVAFADATLVLTAK